MTYRPVREGAAKLQEMLVSAILEALAAGAARLEETVLFLCLPEVERPGRLPGLDPGFASSVRSRVEKAGRLASRERVFEAGTMGGIRALLEADQFLARREATACVVAGVDTFLTAETLAAYHAQRRLITLRSSDGFLPGEAAAAIVVSHRSPAGGSGLRCLGIGLGQERATMDSDQPLRADGLVKAYQAAFQDAGTGYEQIDYRLTDINGEQYAFKDAALALSRTLRKRRETMDLWHPSDCVGRIDAAAVPLVLGVALAAARKLYAPGPGVLCHFSDDTGARAAAVLRAHGQAGG